MIRLVGIFHSASMTRRVREKKQDEMERESLIPAAGRDIKFVTKMMRRAVHGISLQAIDIHKILYKIQGLSQTPRWDIF